MPMESLPFKILRKNSECGWLHIYNYTTKDISVYIKYGGFDRLIILDKGAFLVYHYFVRQFMEVTMQRHTIQWTVSIPPLLSKEALKIAREESRTKSELIREALRRYLENRTFDRIRQKLSRRFQRMGIKTEEDIERLIDEGRG